MPDPGQVCHLPSELRDGPFNGDRSPPILSRCAADAEAAAFAWSEAAMREVDVALALHFGL